MCMMKILMLMFEDTFLTTVASSVASTQKTPMIISQSNLTAFIVATRNANVRTVKKRRGLTNHSTTGSGNLAVATVVPVMRRTSGQELADTVEWICAKNVAALIFLTTAGANAPMTLLIGAVCIVGSKTTTDEDWTDLTNLL